MLDTKAYFFAFPKKARMLFPKLRTELRTVCAVTTIAAATLPLSACTISHNNPSAGPASMKAVAEIERLPPEQVKDAIEQTTFGGTGLKVKDFLTGDSPGLAKLEQEDKLAEKIGESLPAKDRKCYHSFFTPGQGRLDYVIQAGNAKYRLLVDKYVGLNAEDAIRNKLKLAGECRVFTAFQDPLTLDTSKLNLRYAKVSALDTWTFTERDKEAMSITAANGTFLITVSTTDHLHKDEMTESTQNFLNKLAEKTK